MTDLAGRLDVAEVHQPDGIHNDVDDVSLANQSIMSAGSSKR